MCVVYIYVYFYLGTSNFNYWLQSKGELFYLHQVFTNERN